ncbi:MAG: RNA polymerase sigma factor [Brevibacterium sp.]
MDSESAATARALTVFGEEDHGRLLAALATRFHDLDLAEEALQEALLRAVETWPDSGVPRKPAAWLMSAAKNRAIDLIRLDATRTRNLARLRIEDELRPGDHQDHATQLDEDIGTAEIPDERLGLFFTCSHSTLKEEEQTALILRFLAGLSTVEVAAAFLTETTTMQQRIVRAKKRIAVTGIPFGRPGNEQVRERMPGVLRAVYLIFAQGFTPAAGASRHRVDLQDEAVRLARLLVTLAPRDTEARGLLALLLLTRSRAEARTSAAGKPVPLAEQDRRVWDSRDIAEGLALTRAAAGEDGAGIYTVQATIAALHAEASTFADTDWAQILVLYRMLYGLDPTPVVALNQAVVIGKVSGPEAGLAALEALAEDRWLLRHRPFHIARAITLEECGRPGEAEEAYRAALACPGNDAESEYLESQLNDLGS